MIFVTVDWKQLVNLLSNKDPDPVDVVVGQVQGDVGVLDLAQLRDRIRDFDQRRLGFVVQRERMV